MNNTTTLPSQTRSFTALFLIEMWERFGYYGMQALIVYYMVQKLGVAALLCTVIAIAVLPLMKKLSLTHHGQGAQQ